MKTFWFLVERVDFVESRYRNFLKKKEIFGWPLPKWATMTDLDRDYGLGKPMKDVVVCDACNEDILERFITMFEDRSVYHGACAKTYSGYNLKETAPITSYDNVVSVDFEALRRIKDEKEKAP